MVARLASAVGTRVRSRRESLGVRQSDLAERAGVSTELVSRIETGRGLPSVETLIALALALDTTPNDLLGFDPNPKGRVSSELAAVLSRLPPSRLRDVQKIAEAFVEYRKR